MTWNDLTAGSFDNRGCRVHYWHRPGTGNRYLFFFHGASADHRMFELQIEAFDASDHLVFWDARGHGQSRLPAGLDFRFEDMVDDAWKLYELFGIETAAIVGQSMGGNLAQELVWRAPEKVSQLVLIGCTNNTQTLSTIDAWTLRLAPALFALMPWSLIISAGAKTCGNKAWVQEYVAQCLRAIDKKTFLRLLTETLSCLREDPDYRFPLAVQLICGADDRAGNIRKAMLAWPTLDAAVDLQVVKDAGHNTNQDQPDAVNVLLRDYFYRSEQT